VLVIEAVITVRKPIPNSITAAAMSRPVTDSGTLSPYPTVVVVWTAHQSPDPIDGYRSWSVTVSHATVNDLRLLGTWGPVTGRQSGDDVVFTGGPLAAGAATGFGYQVGKSGRGNARPSGCSVVGGRCGVS